MTNYKGESCFVMGGFQKGATLQRNVSRYNLGKDQWELGTPALQVARRVAAACTIGDNIFIFAGYDSDNFQHLLSVEKLNVPEIVRGAAWELIQLPESVFAPRTALAVIPINESEIAILGGCAKNNNYLSDVVVFNVKSQACHKIIEEGKGFASPNNQIALLKNKVVALVVDEEGCSLIEWILGQDAVTVLQNYPGNEDSDD